MTDFPVTVRIPRGVAEHVFEDYSNGAITAAANKREWICTFYGRLVDVICDSEVAGSGGVSDIVDVNINGTTVYTTQANRPTLLVGNTGMFTEAGEPEINTVVPGDIISYDIDQIATTGSARFKISICFIER